METLAPYAQFSARSRGRMYPEKRPEWRTEFQRDRDRVIHSRAFRRLEYKTQVFLNGTGDHLRTRLTHTMEVAAIARNISSALRLNDGLAEAIALAHDLGHAPFGHSGESVLNRLMERSGGFEHNRQSLRIVEHLEQKYPRFPGLNLTAEVRDGLTKHRNADAAEGPSLEAQAANLADEITYYSHDLDDGLESGLLSEEKLRREVPLWAQADESVRREYGDLPDECRRYFIIRCLIDGQVQDVVLVTEANLARANITSAEGARATGSRLVDYSPDRRELNRQLRGYLYENLYYNPIVHEPNQRGMRMLERLFRHFLENPRELGDQSLKRADLEGLPRAVCDYLSGMTDRYAQREYSRVFEDRLPS